MDNFPPDSSIPSRLPEMLSAAQKGGYAVGSFSPRYTPVIRAVLRAGKKLRSPLIVQISQKEMERAGIEAGEFASEFFRQIQEEDPQVPVVLHLDHTRNFAGIQAAVESGFSSVMIDASAFSLPDNIAATREVVEYAHRHGVAVEAELGRIGTADFIETDSDDELFTDPQEAEFFVRQTGIDALAVSVGTAHGVYTVRQPRIDLQILSAIRARTQVALVLHGGSGTPVELIRSAITLPGGGISKINIATDLEEALLAALDLDSRVSNNTLQTYSSCELEKGLRAVQSVVEDKILNFLMSGGRG